MNLFNLVIIKAVKSLIVYFIAVCLRKINIIYYLQFLYISQVSKIIRIICMLKNIHKLHLFFNKFNNRLNTILKKNLIFTLLDFHCFI